MEVRTCACGCGTPLSSQNARFVRGHNSKVTAAVRPTHGARNCEMCGNPLPPTKDFAFEAARRFCRKCSAVAKRSNMLRPWNDLQRRVLRHMADNGLSGRQFARLVGDGEDAFGMWFACRGRARRRAVLERYAAFFNATLAEVVAESGGRTAEERKAESARLNLAKAGQSGHTPQARAKAAAALRGRPLSAQHRATLSAAIRSSADYPERGRRLVAWHESDRGRLVQRLWPYWHSHRSATKDDVHRWAEEVASKLPTDRKSVLNAWVPYARRLWPGVFPKGGRPPAKRFDVVASLRASWTRRPNGTMASGFVKAAWEAAEKVEGKRIDLAAFEKWLYRQRWPG